MRLNNKGFAITGILYGLLILFALLVGSYLTVLTARKNRLDGIVENIEDEYNNKTNTTYTLTFIKGIGINRIYYSKNTKDTTFASAGSDSINVETGDIVYYYVEADTSSGYTANCSNINSPCSITISNKNETLTINGTIMRYTLTLTKGTGIDYIFYKKGSASTYTRYSGNVSDFMAHGTRYSYYVVASSGYIVNECASETNACSEVIKSTVNKTLLGVAISSSFTVTLEVDDEDYGTTAIEKGGKYSQTFQTPTTSISVSCTNEQKASVSVSGRTATITIDSVTADTKCTVTYQ